MELLLLLNVKLYSGKKDSGFPDMTPHHCVISSRRFGGTQSLHLQGSGKAFSDLQASEDDNGFVRNVRNRLLSDAQS